MTGRSNHRPGLRRRGLSMVAVAAVAGLMTLAPATSATASPATSAAGTTSFLGSVVLYEGVGLTGEHIGFGSAYAGTCVDLAEFGWADRANSVANSFDGRAALFPHEDCIGGPYPVDTVKPDLGTFSPNSVWVPYS